MAKEGRVRVLKPGRNCWRIARADKVAVLIDSSDYYARLEQALRQAKRSILIIGWAFDGRVKLCPDRDDCPPLRDFLRSLVEAKPELEVRILVWSAAVIHAPGDPVPLLLGAPWQNHPRITVRLDRQHPLYASHHQKLVAIDDALVFCGGIDLTIGRWDTAGHHEADPLRVRPDGSAYCPVHDVQMVAAGEAAGVAADVARERWRIATGEFLSAAEHGADLWPPDLVPDFTDIPVAIARTVPAWGDAPAVHEIAALTEDLLSAARHSIYIETQYFAAGNVRRILEKSLAAAVGPEIVVIVRRASPGVLERLVMGSNRDRLIRHLRRIDRHNRLRVFYPVVPGSDKPCELLVHAKVVVVDEDIVRIGSSNLNNRSMGLDTECDLAVEAANDIERRAIRQLRERLLAEHIGVTPTEIAQAVVDRGSLIHGIDACNRNVRGLRPFPETDLDGPTEPITGTGLLDPLPPVELL
ncbi:phospholipase [Bradyrhizobium icense]|uniref:Phospholipase D n=1 Tax=Bradyrhizobium icense TaxID=1274631 RepID=A0A1B1URX1_9BRAD|nr:phospholipase [Bradyrhizobium icense]